MVRFASALREGSDGLVAARDAARDAVSKLRDASPALAVVFASAAYENVDAIPSAVLEEVGSVPLVGGTAGGCVFGGLGFSTHGVVVVLVGGDGLRAATATAPIAGRELLDVVPAAKGMERLGDEWAARGFGELACLAFAPGSQVDGDALVAALRKGCSARAQLAGGLTGDDFTFDRAAVFAGEATFRDRAVLAGLFSRAPLGVAARHGWRPVGPLRTITRADGVWLVELDGRPALDVWLEDARSAGASPPDARGVELAIYLANNYELGLVDRRGGEAIVRASFDVRADRAVRLSASVPEHARARVMHATTPDLLEAARDASRAAARSAGGAIAGGLVLACSGRYALMGEEFASEPTAIAASLGAPIGGACVFGEIARGRREPDAFHNTTAVIVAFPTDGPV